MKNAEYFKFKKVIIVGLARSGVACANLLYDLGARVSITENKDAGSLRANIELLKSKDIKLELGNHSEEFIKCNELMIISPGVENKAQPVLLAEKHGIPVISEIEFAYMLCPAEIIAVTGSSGKTTVTTLVGKIIGASGCGLQSHDSHSEGDTMNPYCAKCNAPTKGNWAILMRCGGVSEFLCVRRLGC